EIEVVRGAACYEGKGLNWLYGGASGRDDGLVSDARHGLAVGSHGYDCSTMPGFDDRSARYFDQYRKRIIHSYLLGIQGQVTLQKHREKNNWNAFGRTTFEVTYQPEEARIEPIV